MATPRHPWPWETQGQTAQRGETPLMEGMGPTTVLAILLLALLCSCFGLAFQPIAQRVLSAEAAGIYTAINPCWACLLGIVFASESASFGKLAGCVLVLVALVLVTARKDGAGQPAD